MGFPISHPMIKSSKNTPRCPDSPFKDKPRPSSLFGNTRFFRNWTSKIEFRNRKLKKSTSKIQKHRFFCQKWFDLKNSTFLFFEKIDFTNWKFENQNWVLTQKHRFSVKNGSIAKIRIFDFLKMFWAGSKFLDSGLFFS